MIGLLEIFKAVQALILLAVIICAIFFIGSAIRR